MTSCYACIDQDFFVANKECIPEEDLWKKKFFTPSDLNRLTLIISDDFYSFIGSDDDELLIPYTDLSSLLKRHFNDTTVGRIIIYGSTQHYINALPYVNYLYLLTLKKKINNRDANPFPTLIDFEPINEREFPKFKKTVLVRRKNFCDINPSTS